MNNLVKNNKKYKLLWIVIIFSSICIFHILILLWIIPYNMVWWWNIESKEKMYLLESISILLNIIILSIFLINYWYLTKNKRIIKYANTSMWLIFFIFALNTIGNIFSKNLLEKIIFTPITLILSIISLNLIKKNKKN